MASAPRHGAPCLLPDARSSLDPWGPFLERLPWSVPRWPQCPLPTWSWPPPTDLPQPRRPFPIRKSLPIAGPAHPPPWQGRVPPWHGSSATVAGHDWLMWKDVPAFGVLILLLERIRNADLAMWKGRRALEAVRRGVGSSRRKKVRGGTGRGPPWRTPQDLRHLGPSPPLLRLSKTAFRWCTSSPVKRPISRSRYHDAFTTYSLRSQHFPTGGDSRTPCPGRVYDDHHHYHHYHHLF